MSTRSNIAILNTNGTVEEIYCHNDGNPAGVGKILLEHYNTEPKVRELIALGDISILGEVIGEKHDFDWMSEYGGEGWEKLKKDPRYTMCLVYGRDRGETETGPRMNNSMRIACENMDNDYAYVFNVAMGRWSYRADGQEFSQLTEKACKEE